MKPQLVRTWKIALLEKKPIHFFHVNNLLQALLSKQIDAVVALLMLAISPNINYEDCSGNLCTCVWKDSPERERLCVYVCVCPYSIYSIGQKGANQNSIMTFSCRSHGPPANVKPVPSKLTRKWLSELFIPYVEHKLEKWQCFWFSHLFAAGEARLKGLRVGFG